MLSIWRLAWCHASRAGRAWVLLGTLSRWVALRFAERELNTAYQPDWPGALAGRAHVTVLLRVPLCFPVSLCTCTE